MSLYNYSITENLNKLFFCFDVSKGGIIKVFCCLWLSNRCRNPNKHKMRVTSPYMFKYNMTETYFWKFFPSILNIWSAGKFSPLNVWQNKYHPAGELLHIWTQGNNIFFQVKRKNNRKTIFVWTDPSLENYTSLEKCRKQLVATLVQHAKT